MKISSWAIRHPIPIIVLFIALSLGGVASFLRLPINANPNVNFPIVSVTVTQTGASPTQLESSTTRRIEDAVAERAIVFLDENGDETRPDHPSNAAWRLGMSFIHMTNNRLMVSIEDEAYLAFEILQAMEAGTTEAAA